MSQWPSAVVDGFDLASRVDSEGTHFVLSGVEGLFAGGGVRLDRQERLARHGEFAQRGYRENRLITLTGYVVATPRSRGRVLAALNEFAALAADGGFVDFAFTDIDMGALHARVQLADASDIEFSGRHWFGYQLHLLTTTPYLFGATSTGTTGFAVVPSGVGLMFDLFSPDGVLDFGPLGSTGTATVTNAGTAPAAPRFTITGPIPSEGFRIEQVAGAGALTYLGDCPDNSTLVIDTGDGTVLLNGTANRQADLIVDAWPSVPAGGSADFLFEPLGSVTDSVLTATVRATYW